MKIADAIALQHDGVTKGGAYGFHVIVVEEEVHEINSEEVRRHATTCLVRWWLAESDGSAEESDRSWERHFEIDREGTSNAFHIAWRSGDDYPPAELTAALYDHVSEKLAGARE